MWGRNLLVAPVVEKNASTRHVYLPHGSWYDFWTGEAVQGGREISRPVDLETMPLYVRTGSILPLGPVKQFVAEKSDQPYSITVYPGADATFLLYEDDGTSFAYRKGQWTGVQMNWSESGRRLTVRLAEGSRILSAGRREFEVKLVKSTTSRKVAFQGDPVEVNF
jgi:alpha-glucosidase/alpha-D-xyloside xylohydrolase